MKDFENDPEWSPDGTKIAFCKATTDHPLPYPYTMNTDGSEIQVIAENPALWGLTWSPDGKKIALAGMESDPPNIEIYVVNANGRNLKNLSNSSAFESYPAWCCRLNLAKEAESLLRQAEQSFGNFEFQKAEDYASQAREIYERLGSDEDLSLVDKILLKYQTALEAEGLLSEGKSLMEQGEYETAEEKLTQAQEKFEQIELARRVSEIGALLSEIDEMLKNQQVMLETDALFEQGKEAFQREEYETALDLFQQVREKYLSIESDKVKECDEWIQKTEAQIQAKAEEEKGFCLGTLFLAILFVMGLISARLAREQQFMNL